MVTPPLLAPHTFFFAPQLLRYSQRCGTKEQYCLFKRLSAAFMRVGLVEDTGKQAYFPGANLAVELKVGGLRQGRMLPRVWRLV